jgi:hypothetical protein
MAMKIPEIRDELTIMAAQLQEMAVNLAMDAEELQAKARNIRTYVAELYRRPAVRRAPHTRAKVTPELKRQIKAYAADHPRMHMATIGRRFNVDGGRVSEILGGKRT